MKEHWYDVYVIVQIVDRTGEKVGTDDRFIRTVLAESLDKACESVSGHSALTAKRTPLHSIAKNWLIAKTYAYWPKRAFETEYYYLATGMEGHADERNLGVVYARCKTEARRFATVRLMKKLNTSSDYDWYSGCISAKRRSWYKL